MITSTERAQELYAMAKGRVEKREREGAPPGRIEQDKILLSRFEPGGTHRSPGCEIINFPGFIPGGQPSTWHFHLYPGKRTHVRMTGVADPPGPGKKYLSILVAVNHLFSRGTIVSDSLRRLSLCFTISISSVAPIYFSACDEQRSRSRS